MDTIKDIKFEEIEIDNDIKEEVSNLETELSSCGIGCGGTKDVDE